MAVLLHNNGTIAILFCQQKSYRLNPYLQDILNFGAKFANINLSKNYWRLLITEAGRTIESQSNRRLLTRKQ